MDTNSTGPRRRSRPAAAGIATAVAVLVTVSALAGPLAAATEEQDAKVLEGTWKLDPNLSDAPPEPPSRGGGRGGGGRGGGGRGGSGERDSGGGSAVAPLMSATQLETQFDGEAFVVRAGSTEVRTTMAVEPGGAGASWQGQKLVVRPEQQGAVLGYELINGDRLVVTIEMPSRDGSSSTTRRVFERVD
ncbi:MAG: hypothetical protein GKS06_10750 [Acidobacteria bacterium]|nr:hypothetical protein [Acidobacteriota bacterium]